MPRVIGIDLGTTNSCVAVLERGAATVLATADGERTTPSTVSFSPGGKVLVGIPARRQAITNPERTLWGTKRLIGRKVNAPDVQEFARGAPFQIVAARNGDAWVRLPGEGSSPPHDVSPQEIAAYVLERMKRIAEQALGEPVTQAVVTVPAYFNDAQRQATKDAGRIAGLDVRRILNEPTAAALAYGVHRKKGHHRLAVFDLGGGTFDISILSVENGVFEVLSTNGDTALGGDDWDRRIAAQLAVDFAGKHGIDLAADPVALGRIREEAEKLKKTLSDAQRASVNLPFVAKGKDGNPIHLEREVTRAELDGWTKDLIDRLAAPCKQALADAGLRPEDLGEVLLVGGMSRAPAVQAAVERIFGKKPSKGANPDEIVALGAAAHAGILTGELEGVVLLDVLPQSLGIRVGDGFSPLIPKNSTVPARARKLFATSRDDQPFVAVEIFQGESKLASENRYLGKLTLEGLPPGKAGTVRVELSFLVDADGILSVSAKELSTGREASMKVAPSGGLDDAELDRIVDERRKAPDPGA